MNDFKIKFVAPVFLFILFGNFINLRAQDPVDITVNVSQSLGTYKQFWGGLGQSSFYDGVLAAPNQLYFSMIEEENQDGRQTFTYFDSKSMFNNQPHVTGEEIGAYVYSEDANGNPQYNWSMVDPVIDALLAAKLIPIINFSFMPSALASDVDRTNPWHNSIVSPPKDYDKWRNLIYETVKHLQDRYGAAEIETWYFEVWNEPDLDNLFWIAHPDTVNYPNKSDNIEYFKLYDYTVDGAIQANPNIKIGGPAIAGDIDFFINQWLPHIEAEANFATGEIGSRVDFISRHSYGTIDKIVFRYTSTIGAIKNRAPDIYQKIVDDEIKYLITEAAPTAKTETWHNSRYPAAWLTKLIHAVFNIGDTEGQEYMPDIICFWTKPLPHNFKKHFGLATRIGDQWNLADNQIVKRPVFNAFTALGMMGSERVQVTAPEFGSEVNAFATKTGNNSVEIILYHLKEEDFENDDFAGTYPVNLSVSGLPFTEFQLKYYAINATHSNAYQQWITMGSPDPPSPDQITFLKSVDDLQTVEPTTTIQAPDRILNKEIQLQHNSVAFLVLTNAGDSDTTPPASPTGVHVSN